MRIRDRSETVTGLRTGYLAGRANRGPRFDTGTAAQNKADALAWRPASAGGYFAPSGSFNRVDVMTDVEVTDFHKRIARGEFVPTNPCTKTYSSNGYFGAYYEYQYLQVSNAGRYYAPSYIQWWYSAHFAAPSLGALTSYDPLVVSARAKLQQGYMDVLTSMSEFHKTVSMIVGFKKRLQQAIRGLVREASRKGLLAKVRTVREALDILASFWLEYRFGWRILWYEYNSIIDVINSLDKEISRRSFRDRKNSSKIETGTWQSVDRNAPWEIRYTDSQVVNQSAGATGTARLDGRVMLDPLTTAWELLPLSWVIDTAWNVGDVLSSISPFGAFNIDETWTSANRESSRSVEIRVKDGWLQSRNLAGVEINELRNEISVDIPLASRSAYNRQIFSDGFVAPSPEFNLSFLKALDLGSLALVLRHLVFDVVQRNRL